MAGSSRLSRIVLGAGRAPLATVLGFRSFDLDEDRPPRVTRIGHHFRMRTESRLRVRDAIGPSAINALCERAPGALRAVRVQHSDAAAGIDPEIEDVPDVLVHEHVLRSANLLPDDHVLVLEELCRPLSWKLRWPFLGGGPIGLGRRHGGQANHRYQNT